jgi:flagellar protein FliS
MQDSQSAQNQSVQIYKEASVNTASPGVLILMLYDGVLQGINRAEYGVSLTNIVKKNEEIHNGLMRAHEILRELQQSLDMEVDTDFGDRMYALYGFMLDRIFDANVKKNLQDIPPVKAMIQDIRDAWDEMLRKSPDSGV